MLTRFLNAALASCCLFLSSIAIALPQSVEFERIGNSDAIPDNVITTMVEDASGFIWLGTPSGLLRYDGYRFRLFSYSPYQANSLAGNFVRTLHADPKGRIWVGSEPGGLAVYIPKLDSFLRLDESSSINGIEQRGRVTSLAGNGEHGVWLGTSAGVFEVHLTQDLQFSVTPVPDTTELSVRTLVNDSQGRLWMGGQSGLHIVSTDQTERVGIATEAPVRSLYAADDGYMFVGTEGAGAYKVDTETLELLPIEAIRTRDTIYAFGTPSEHTLWVAFHGGIVQLNRENYEQRSVITHDPSNPYSLANNDIRSVLHDSAGQVWVAGYGGGLQRLLSASAATTTLRFSLLNDNALSDPNVSSVLELDNGEIWIGTRGAGIDRFEPATGRLEPLNLTIDEGWISALSQDHSGHVWVGANPGRLYRVDPETREVEAISFWNASARRLLTTRNGEVWVGTGRGVGRWNADTQQVERLALVSGSQWTDSVNALVEDNLGGVWVGAGTSGLYYLPPNGQEIVPIEGERSDEIHLSQTSVLGLLWSDSQQLYIDTPEGLWSWQPDIENPERLHFNGRNVSAAFGFDGSPFGANLLEDNEGRIWSPEYIYNPSESTMWALHRADGIDIGTSWYRSFNQRQNGQLMFGGSRGLLFIDPTAFRRWSYTPPVVATELRTNGREVSLGRLADTLVIRNDERSFAIEFAALDYSDPLRNRYRFQLEGFDREWIETDAGRRVAAYGNLWPGQYKLIVEGSNRYGDWSPHRLVIPIRVEASFWQTPWFAMLVTLVLMLIFYGIMLLRTRYLEHNAKHLEQVIAERTEALRDAQRDLIEREKMASLGALVAGVSHEINTPVGIAVTAASTLDEFTRKILQKMTDGELTRTEFTQYGQHVADSSDLILRSLERARTLITSFKQVAVDQSSQQRRQFHLTDFLDEVQHSLRPIYSRLEHRLEIDCPSEIVAETYPGALFQVLSNLIVNAVTHGFDSPHGVMIIKVRERGDFLVLTFSDDGQGMPAEVVEKAFDPFFTTKRGSGGSGLGLHIVYNFVTQILQGDIKLKSQLGQGTLFTIRFPKVAP